MNRLFVVNKPIFVSSNNYMRSLRRRYGTKKIGYSGTLDPFATGTLIVATGQYTKLFRYLHKEPKVYRATLWLGAESPSFDIENIVSVRTSPALSESRIAEVLESMKGEIEYIPPKYSAKKVRGKRAYEAAREGMEIELSPIRSTIYGIFLLGYSHPFIHFELSVSEGSYIRSIGQMISRKLGMKGTLSSLHRVSEGKFFFENERSLDPFEYLRIPKNDYLGDEENLHLGRKLERDAWRIKEEGEYLVESSSYFSIIKIENETVKYILNRLEKPDA